MTAKCIDFLTEAFRRWGSELALIVIVCLLISFVTPALNLMIFGNKPFDIDDGESSPHEVSSAFEYVFSDFTLADELFETLSSVDYENGLIFHHEMDSRVLLVLKYIGRWILVGLVWFLIVFPYMLCGLASVFSKEDTESGLVSFFNVKLSEYVRMVGAAIIMSIRTLIAAVFIFGLVYGTSIAIYGELKLWLLLVVSGYMLIYRTIRFFTTPFFIMNTNFSPGKCINLSWNFSGKYYWTLFLFACFPFAIGVLGMLIFGYRFSIVHLTTTLAFVFSMILITPIAKHILEKTSH
ncbi:MAG: hypothetical protein R2883_06660 [Caldisericia bacterium]